MNVADLVAIDGFKPTSATGACFHRDGRRTELPEINYRVYDAAALKERRAEIARLKRRP